MSMNSATKNPAAKNSALSEIQNQIMWNRLIAIVEEQAQTLIRTAFSTSAREAGDLSAGVFDTQGRMLAQAVTGTPGHVNAMAASVKFFLDKYPAHTMRPGDVYVTNDPWMGTGHLHDFTMVTPTFYQGRAIGLFASTTHVVDIGGIGFSADGRQVYDEGLYMPILPLAREGQMDESIMEIVRANVREPIQVEGDLYSLMACNEIGCRRLVEMMDEFELEDLDELGAYMVEHSHRAMLDEIAKLPKGTYHNAMRVDGYDKPLDLVAALTIADDGIYVDFAGTTGVSNFGINVPITYTQAYASFGVRCLVGPSVPNNAGSLSAVKVTAPKGTILNAPHPCAVAARHITGQMLPDVVMGALHKAVAGRAPAEGTSCLWNPMLLGGHGLVPEEDFGDGTPFAVNLFHTGGAGARPLKDGLSATAFPSGVRNTPVEINESIAPIVVWRKEYREDSGGAGEFRGGTGQIMDIASSENAPFAIAATFDRVHHAPRGREGGRDGFTGKIELQSGQPMRNKGTQSIPRGDCLHLEMPGGGGYGDPRKRDVESVAMDVRDGMVSKKAALDLYGVVLDDDGAVDAAATEQQRNNSETAVGSLQNG